MPCNCDVSAQDSGSKHSNGCQLNGHQPHRKMIDSDEEYLDPQTSGKAPRESVRLILVLVWYKTVAYTPLWVHKPT